MPFIHSSPKLTINIEFKFKTKTTEQNKRQNQQPGRKSDNRRFVKPAFEGYTHCLMRGPMSFPDTLEIDLRNPEVDTSIWLHM